MLGGNDQQVACSDDLNNIHLTVFIECLSFTWD